MSFGESRCSVFILIYEKHIFKKCAFSFSTTEQKGKEGINFAKINANAVA